MQNCDFDADSILCKTSHLESELENHHTTTDHKSCGSIFNQSYLLMDSFRQFLVSNANTLTHC